MLNKTTLGAIIISILYGISAIPAAIIIKDIPQPVLMLLTSSTYFCTVFAFYIHSKHLVTDVKLNSQLIGLIMFLAIICTWLPNYIYYHIINEHNTTLVSAISSIYPMWTLLFSYFFLSSQTKITKEMVIGLAMIIVGVFLVSKH